MKFHKFNIWAKRKFGIVSVTPFDVQRFIARHCFSKRVLANAAEGFHPGGKWTAYPIDFPYATRYLMVSFAPQGSAQPNPGLPGITLSPLINLYPTTRLAIPLGIATDEPDNTSLDSVPYGTNVQLIGGAAAATCIGVSDSVVTQGTLLVGSTTVAGELTSLPNVPGSYWSPGLALSTSEGLGAQIEFDPRVQVVNVDVIT